MEDIYEVVSNTTIKPRQPIYATRRSYTVDNLVELLLEIQKGGWGDLPVVVPDDGRAFDLEEWSIVPVRMSTEHQEDRIYYDVIADNAPELTLATYVHVDAIALWTSKDNSTLGVM